MFLKLALFLTSLIVTLPFSNVTRSVSSSVNLSNLNGDDFSLIDKSYESDEDFVFTTRATFNEGQACGIVFGGEQNDHYWVFNVDRYDNRTKLMYFSNSGSGMSANVLKEDYFIGNDKVTSSELTMINRRLPSCNEFYFKVVISHEDNHTFGEFYIDNIKRFDIDNPIDISSYEGGYLGYNVYRASVSFDKINFGKKDNTYYTEKYRNQFHYSQFAHWNNDPNGMVYYNGYYHLYYQTNPYSKNWGDMYWGHARSKDLVHWEELPIALFPDDGNMGVGLGDGFAWSGCAMVYHPGMSEDIDNKNWFPNGGGTGLIGYYTRDGMRQDQVIITSDDDGITWVKRQHIPQDRAISVDYKVDCRDPSVFPLEKEGKHRAHSSRNPFAG